MAKTDEPEPNVAEPGKAIQELVRANTAVMDAWYAEHIHDQKLKAEEIVKAARAKQRESQTG